MLGDIDLAHAFEGWILESKTGVPGFGCTAGYVNEAYQLFRGSYPSVLSPEDQPSMLFGTIMYATEGSDFIEKFNNAYTAMGPKEASRGYSGKLNSRKIPQTISPFPVPLQIPNPLYYILT